jgi:DNA replication initiation complex subunit (GINS family)
MMILHKDRMGKIVTMASFNTLSWHFSGMTEENHKKSLALAKIQADST